MGKEYESQSELIDKIETAAGMVYDKIQYIVKDDDQYPVERKTLPQILFDLENGYHASPF